MRSEKKKKEEFVDDGRVIASMDSEYINGYRSSKHRENRQALREEQITRKERWAMYKGALAQFMPIFGVFITSLILVIFFLYFFWMN